MQVLVLGGGYAGVSLVRDLVDRLPEDVDLTLVDDTGEHLVKHEVHRVVRRPSLAEDITLDLAAVADGATVREAEVTAVDPDERTVTLANGDRLSYDVCAVCLGADTAYYDIDGLRDHGLPLQSVDDALAIRAGFLETLEEGGRVVVGGAGLSGVQVAGELAALAEAEGASDAVTVELVEQLPAVAPGFDEGFQQAIRAALDDYGIEIRTGATVAAADAGGVDLADGDRIDCETLVWTGGIAGQAALDGDRPRVRATMTLGERTFVLGDAARVVDVDGEAVPASAQAAIRQAPVVAESVAALVADAGGAGSFRPRLQRFAFDSPGWVVSVGDDAVAQVGPTVLRGRAALALKTSVGAGYLSSVGAVQDAVSLVNEELGLGAAAE